METAQHWDSLAKNQLAEITMVQISEVQEFPAFNGRRSFLTLRGKQGYHRTFLGADFEFSLKNQPAEITMFQISEVQESLAFNGGRSYLTLRLRFLTVVYTG